MAPDERFAPGGNRPSGGLVAWRTAIEPVRATDLEGCDVAEIAPRRPTARPSMDSGGSGAGSAMPRSTGSCSTSATASARYGPDARSGLPGRLGRIPLLADELRGGDRWRRAPAPVGRAPARRGSWAVIEPDAGYPAGLPRLTLLDLSGKLAGPNCVIRLRTNLECYWDRAFVAVRDPPDAQVRVTPCRWRRLGSATAGSPRSLTRRPPAVPLRLRPRRVRPAGPDVGPLDPLRRRGRAAPLRRRPGSACSGPETRSSSNSMRRRPPRCSPGWIRSYVLHAVGYCKDADPFTATSDNVGPLPWRGMPAYPFGPEGERPRSGLREYLRTYQTRPSGGRKDGHDRDPDSARFIHLGPRDPRYRPNRRGGRR